MTTMNTTITNAQVLANVCAIAQKYNFTMYFNAKKPHLYLFYYEGETDKKTGRKPMVFKIRYSESKRVNMLVKSRYAVDAVKLAELFNESKDNECNYEKNIAGLSYKDIQKIFAAIGKESVPEKTPAPEKTPDPEKPEGESNKQ